jgi:hypothetical protein
LKRPTVPSLLEFSGVVTCRCSAKRTFSRVQPSAVIIGGYRETKAAPMGAQLELPQNVPATIYILEVP